MATVAQVGNASGLDIELTDEEKVLTLDLDAGAYVVFSRVHIDLQKHQDGTGGASVRLRLVSGRVRDTAGTLLGLGQPVAEDVVTPTLPPSGSELPHWVKSYVSLMVAGAIEGAGALELVCRGDGLRFHNPKFVVLSVDSVKASVELY